MSGSQAARSPWWSSDTANEAQHRDHEDSGPRGGPAGPAVTPHAQIPLGVWRDVIRLIDREGKWLDEHGFVNEAVREKVAREIGRAIRKAAEGYGISGSRVRFDSEETEYPHYP